MEGSLLTIDFWDVGQGDCTTIRLPNGKVILIDGGTRGSPIIDWLSSRLGRGIELEAIVLTHNDADHAGALPGIIALKKDQIGGIWMLVDDDIKSPRFQKIFRAAAEGEDQGHYRIRRAEYGQEIWSSPEGQAVIKIIHPGFSENVRSKSSNDTSALIVLEVDGQNLLAWAGDLKLKKAAEVLALNPPKMLMGPHHGGPSDYPSKSVRKTLSPKTCAARRREIVVAVENLSPERLWVSVGTTNTHMHPRPGYLDLVAKGGGRVVCSQITNCCDRKSILSKRPVMQGSALLGLPSPRTGVACRGSMRLHLKEGQLLPDRFDREHLERVGELLRSRCLVGAGWRQGDEIPDSIS